MAILAAASGIAAGTQAVGLDLGDAFSFVGDIFGNDREEKRARRDKVKSALLGLGVNRSAWQNFNSDSVKAGTDLYAYLAQNPSAVDYINRNTIGGNINRSNVDSFIREFEGVKASQNTGTGGDPYGNLNQYRAQQITDPQTIQAPTNDDAFTDEGLPTNNRVLNLGAFTSGGGGGGVSMNTVILAGAGLLAAAIIFKG